MGISIDTSGIGVGLGLLADAIVRKKQRERLGQFQASTSILARLQDPTLDIEGRNALKQQLATVLRMPDASAIPDDMSELTGQFDTILRQNFPEIASSPLHGKQLDDIMTTARANEKMGELSSRLDVAFQGARPEVQEFLGVLKDADPELYVKSGMQLLASRAQLFAGADDALSLRQSDIGEEQFAQQMRDEWTMFDNVTFPQYKKKMEFQAALYPRTGGGGGGSGKTVSDVYKVYETMHKDGTALINEAMDNLDARRKDRDAAITAATDSGVDINGLAQSRFVDGHEGSKPLSELDVLGLLNEKGGNPDALYSELKPMYPTMSRKDLNEMIVKYQDATPEMRAAISNYFVQDARYQYAAEVQLPGAQEMSKRAAAGLNAVADYARSNPGDIESLVVGDVAAVKAGQAERGAAFAGSMLEKSQPSPQASISSIQEDPTKGSLLWTNMVDDMGKTAQDMNTWVEKKVQSNPTIKTWLYGEQGWDTSKSMFENMSKEQKASGRLGDYDINLKKGDQPAMTPGQRDVSEDAAFKSALAAARTVPMRSGTPQSFINSYPTIDSWIESVKRSIKSTKPLSIEEQNELEQIWIDQSKGAKLPTTIGPNKKSLLEGTTNGY